MENTNGKKEKETEKEKTDFYEILSDLASTPSEFHYEAQIGEKIMQKLEGLVDRSARDELGNIYAARIGAKPGRILFSAHQDKVMGSTQVGIVELNFESKPRNQVLIFPRSIGPDNHKTPLYLRLGEKYVPIEITGPALQEDLKTDTFLIDTPSRRGSKEGLLQRFPFKIIGEKYEAINSLLSEEKKSRQDDLRQTLEKLFFNVPVYALGRPKIGEKKIRGKMDDALGLSLILDLLQETKPDETPTLGLVLTVGEEDGSAGARYCVGKGYINEMFDKIIVIDTSPLERPGAGIILYQDCKRESQFRRRSSAYFSRRLLSDNEDREDDDREPSFRYWGSGGSDEDRADDDWEPRKPDMRRPPEKNPRGKIGGEEMDDKEETGELSGEETGESSEELRIWRQKWSALDEIVPEKEPLVAEIEAYAAAQGITLITHDAFVNDSNIFAREGTPTVALEVPIQNMHSAEETCSLQDIELMRKFLKGYLTR